MYKLTIKKQDGSIYWVEHFEKKSELDKWLDVEKTRPYWNAQYSEEIEKLVPELTEQQVLKKSLSKKLGLLRSLRNQKMLEVDIMVNDIALGVRSDKASVIAYRQALKDITNPYKNFDSDQNHMDALSALDIDSFEFPVAP